MEDAPLAAALVHDAYVGYVEEMGFRPRPMDDEYSEKLGRLEAWVVPGDGRLDGLLILDPREDHMWVDNVAVNPDAQERGIGGKLLELAEERAANLALGELRLLTHQTMLRNQDIYKHLGWQEYHRGVEDGRERVWFKKPTPSRAE